MTIREFYRPDGASTQLKGVKADIVLPSLTDDSKLAESAMKNPLPWDQVPPARHAELDRVQPYVKPLRERSTARMAGDEGFAYLNHEIAELRKRQAATAVSLNEVVREKEKTQSEADERTWEKKLTAIPTPSVKEYDITAQNAEQPDLPPLVTRTDDPATPAPNPGAEPSLKLNPVARLGDPVLRETELILADYVHLSSHATTFTSPTHRSHTAAGGGSCTDQQRVRLAGHFICI